MVSYGSNMVLIWFNMVSHDSLHGLSILKRPADVVDLKDPGITNQWMRQGKLILCDGKIMVLRYFEFGQSYLVGG